MQLQKGIHKAFEKGMASTPAASTENIIKPGDVIKPVGAKPGVPGPQSTLGG